MDRHVLEVVDLPFYRTRYFLRSPGFTIVRDPLLSGVGAEDGIRTHDLLLGKNERTIHPSPPASLAVAYTRVHNPRTCGAGCCQSS